MSLVVGGLLGPLYVSDGLAAAMAPLLALDPDAGTVLPATVPAPAPAPAPTPNKPPLTKGGTTGGVTSTIATRTMPRATREPRTPRDARYPIGINLWGPFQADSIWDSPDLMATAASPILYDAAGNVAIQYPLAVPYVAGSGVMQFATTWGFTPFIQSSMATGSVAFNMSTTSGRVSFRATTVSGSPYIYITSWSVPAQDVNYPAGTLVDATRNAWTNASTSPGNWPLNPQYLDGTRRTGYPRGLNAGQSLGFSWNGNQAMASAVAGTYTVTARGTGTINIQASLTATGGNAGTTPIAFAAGVPSRAFVLPDGQFIGAITLAASSAADPLRDLRVIMPDRPGHADGFAATYAANAADPYFFLVHPDLVASLRPFAIVRLMDAMQTNNNPFIVEWADRPPRQGTCTGFQAFLNRGPYEVIASLVDQVGVDSWWNVPITASDDYVRQFAAFLLDAVDPALRVAVEYGNENWNGVFFSYIFCAFRACALNTTWVATISYSAATGVATVVRAGHGMATGGVVQVANAVDDGFNGAYPVTVIDPNTFTYVPATPPAPGPAVATPFHPLMAVDAASPHRLPIASLSWDGMHTLTLTTPVAHGCGFEDLIQVSGADDPAFNQLFFIGNSPAAGAASMQLYWTYGGFNRPMPTNPPPGTVAVAARPGQVLAMQRVGAASGATGDACPYFNFQGAFIARRCAFIHETFHDTFAAAGQESRLICCLMWQMPFGPGPGWVNDHIVDAYLAALGGGFLPDCETAIGAAPYFTTTLPNQAPTYTGAVKAISSLTWAGGVATAKVAAHGFPDGARVQVANASQAPYCGVVAISVADGDHFSYPCAGAPTSPATVANGAIPNGIWCVMNPPYQREITAVSVSPDGATMTCTSVGHGWADGLLVNLCGGAVARNLRVPYPGNYGQFLIDVIDPDTFAVTLPSSSGGPNILPTNAARMWAWDSSAIDVLIADLANFHVLLRLKFCRGHRLGGEVPDHHPLLRVRPRQLVRHGQQRLPVPLRPLHGRAQ